VEDSVRNHEWVWNKQRSRQIQKVTGNRFKCLTDTAKSGWHSRHLKGDIEKKVPPSYTEKNCIPIKNIKAKTTKTARVKQE